MSVMILRKIKILATLAFLAAWASGCAIIDTAKVKADEIITKQVDIVSGEMYKTKWFNFTISSVIEVTDYEGYEPSEGNTLFDVEIAVTNTFDKSIPMGIYDFYMSSPVLEKTYPLKPFSKTMMPLEFTLDYDKSAKYHMIYEVPIETEELTLSYAETDEFDKTSKTFILPIDTISRR